MTASSENTTWASDECTISEEHKANYFDATPEGSVCDWEIPVLDDAKMFFMQGPIGCDDGGIRAAVGRKARPPKLVREVRELQACLDSMKHEMNYKADSSQLHSALESKANSWEVADFSKSLASKVESTTLETKLQQKVSHETLQEGLTGKVNQEHFRQLEHQVQGKLDQSFGAALQYGIHQKANQSDFELLRYNVAGKADRASVQAALAQKLNRNALNWKVWSCLVLWAVLTMLCVVVSGIVLYVLLQQHHHIQKLSDSNSELSHTVDQLSIQNQMLNDGLNRKFALLTGGETLEDDYELNSEGEIVAHNQLFCSNRMHEDGYTIELTPPYSSAWVVVDASFGFGHTTCRAKADAILRVEQKIFSFYAPIEVEKVQPTESPSAMAATNENDANISCDQPGTIAVDQPGMIAVATSTTTTAAPCMGMSAAMKMKQSGAIVVLLSFNQLKRTPESNSSHIYNVTGKIQWFPQS